MSMQQNGLAKLVEELGELAQVAGKMIQYPDLQLAPGTHPDGTDLRARIIEEMADVEAACVFVARKLALDTAAIKSRSAKKLERFTQWDGEATACRCLRATFGSAKCGECGHDLGCPKHSFHLSIDDKMTNPIDALAERIDVSKRPPTAATAELDETGEFVLFKSEAGHVVAGMSLKAYQSIIKHPLFRANQTEGT